MFKLIYFLQQNWIVAGTGYRRSAVALAYRYFIFRFTVMHFEMTFNIFLDFYLIFLVHLRDQFQYCLIFEHEFKENITHDP